MGYPLNLLTANFSGRVRTESLGGRQYLVAPLTLIVPGVLDGSRGPLYYPTEELAKNTAVWDEVPIVVYHPYGPDGAPRSAREEGVATIGMLRRPRIHNGRLKADGWFDVERTRTVDLRVLSALQQGRPMELSTGLAVDDRPERGTFNGREYLAIATNYRPDHLAVLPDQVGACSIQDGCGVLMNEQRRKPEESTVEGTLYFNIGRADMPVKFTDEQRKEIVDSLIANCDCWDENDRAVLNKVSDEKLEALQKHVASVVHNRAVAETARKGFEHGDVGFTFNEKDLKFTAKEKAPAPATKKEDPPVVNTQTKAEPPAKPKTAAEWLAEAPPEIQSVVRNAMAAEAEQREVLVKEIVANKANIFTQEYLQTRPLDELRGIAALAKAAVPVPLYTGASVPALNRRSDYDDTDFLPMPGSILEKKTA